MIDRQKLETVLHRRFPGAPLDQIAAAANAIIGLDSDVHVQSDCLESDGRCGSTRNGGCKTVAPRLPSPPS